MLLKVFTVYDSKSEAYLQPFFMQSKGQALRSFTEACNDTNTVFAKYPADFTLFEVGSWDDSTSEFQLYVTKISLGTALEFKAKAPVSPVPSAQADISNFIKAAKPVSSDSHVKQ